ncbi:hypothetical protein BigBertha_32 [Bacillus phage BigBertha]|uniref:Uncharacterized protein n=1 Tax=Bacillus phage BigBertha TaxID=1406781 RepID=U5PRJ9_9CAUD|nr:hypothetical protein BigBertha_32 [Bacillus phage BigBertha]AGY46540.1 hypothetical protein BigBertha_32 [Bacillus phage BigBertha]
MRTDDLVMTVLNNNHKSLKKELSEVIGQSESDMWKKNKDLRTENNRLQNRVNVLEDTLERERNEGVVVMDYGASMEELVNKLSRANQELEDLKYYYRNMIDEFIGEIEIKTGDRKLAETYVENLWYRHAMKKGEQA